ncbi:hypothetical protein DCC62_18200 [candidate division KSB1 bacterium]|nr:MAG: hypothetical protein DCC62_18200 [candidate division KSB1 bacterium]
MSGKGMIIRYIDIVMNLLFGFICMAELSQTSHIQLAKTIELPYSNPDPEIVIFVGITTDGTYLLENEKYHTTDINFLQAYLQNSKEKLAQANYKMRVRLRANHDTPIRFLMQAAAVIQRKKLRRRWAIRA